MHPPTSPLRSRRGIAPAILVVGLGLAALVTYIAAPSVFPGQSRRAAQSTAATATVEHATTAADVAATKQGAEAAAGIVSIGRAAGDLPPSPATDFVRHEVPSVLSKLPAPDPLALLEAEKRRSAVMEGRLAEISALYERDARHTAELQTQLASALADRDEAQRGRREVDLKLETAAAASHGARLVIGVLATLSVIAVLGWLYVRANGFSLAAIGNLRAAIHAGTPAVEALDDLLTPRQKKRVRAVAAAKVGETTLAAGTPGGATQ